MVTIVTNKKMDTYDTSHLAKQLDDLVSGESMIFSIEGYSITINCAKFNENLSFEDKRFDLEIRKEAISKAITMDCINISEVKNHINFLLYVVK